MPFFGMFFAQVVFCHAPPDVDHDSARAFFVAIHVRTIRGWIQGVLEGIDVMPHSFANVSAITHLRW